MKKVRIIALHLAYGGAEKAITEMANIFAEKYDTEIICVYDMPNSPAYALDSRVKLRYLLDDVPNREEWKQSIKELDPVRFARESVRAVRILRGKKTAVRKAIEEIHDGIIVTTRPEDNTVLSKYGDGKAFKIAQLHFDHNFEPGLLAQLRNDYSGIDVLTELTPQLTAEVREIMKDNRRTQVVCVPNFLEHYPENIKLSEKERLVVAAGRLERVKGFDRLIRCFAQVHEVQPEWKLEIIGEGSEHEALAALIAQLGAETYITLTGRLAPSEVEREMARASVYAMTSLSEGLPFVLLEAMSSYDPVVAYDVRTGPGALINDGRDGFLIPDGDSEQFCSRLLSLMEDNELRQTMALSARENSLQYSKDKIAQLWYDIIDRA